MKRIILCILLFTSCRPSVKTSEIEEKLRDLLVLPAFEYVYRDIIFVNEQKYFMMFQIVNKELLFSINLRIQAGIDLGKVYNVISDAPGSIVLTLPEPKIILADADESSIDQMFITEFGKEFTRSDYYTIINQKKEELKVNAINSGIIEKAKDNIQFIVQNILKGFGYPIVTIIYKDTTNENEKIN